MSVSPDVRAELAAQQAALVAALLGRAPASEAPPAKWFAAAAAALSRKRVRAVVRTWPALAQGLGPEFTAEFAQFCREVSLPELGGPLADGRNFAAWLAQRGKLNDQGRLQAFAMDLRFERVREGLKPRRWPTWHVAWFPKSRRLLFGFSIPGTRPLTLAIPLKLNLFRLPYLSSSPAVSVLRIREVD